MALRERPSWRRRSRRALAVRMMAAKVAWLDGRLRWHEGRVAWEGDHGRMSLAPADLARAQRSLNKIARYPIAARLVFGDPDAWLTVRRARLALAKQLSALYTPDLPSLVQQARARSSPAVQQLVALLCAEALCLDTLPVAPSAVLVACGEPAEEPLCAFLGDRTAPELARALGALTLGALHRRLSELQKFPQPRTFDSAWLQRAYTRGLRAGLMPDPALVATLLREEGGEGLVQRCARLAADGEPTQLPPTLLRDLLARGIDPARTVALAEAAASAGWLSGRLLERRTDPPELRRDQWRAEAEERQERQRQAVRALTELVHAFALATADPLAIQQIARFLRAMLDLGDWTAELAEAAQTVLRAGLSLPAELQRSCLEILVENHDRLWDRASLPADGRGNREARRLAGWLQTCWQGNVRPLLKLLRFTGDVNLVREALQQDIYRTLAGQEWRDVTRYRFLLTLSRELCAPGDRPLVWTLGRLLDSIPDVPTARALLQPIVRGLNPAPLWLREHFLESALDAVPWTRQGLAEALPRLARHVPRLVRFAEADTSECCSCRAATAAALALDRASPEAGARWLEWLLGHVTERFSATDRGYEHLAALEIGVPLALTLADGDFQRFQAIVCVALEQPIRYDEERIRPGLAAIERFPGLRAPVAHLFARQSHRCTELLVRAGLAMRLGDAALAPLRALEAAASEQDRTGCAAGAAIARDPSWRELLDLAPDLVATAAVYQRAQRVLGQSEEVPAGVRRVLDRPRRLTRELAYLECILESKPERADLAARCRSLRARLSEEESLQAAIREEARERLAQTTAEARLAAAEQQVLACYRARLEAVAGPLPPVLRFDADLLNATLLTVDVAQNRRLLVRLLRAYLAGDSGWRERHPANAAFLRRLAAQGVDMAAWLAEHPRSFRCAEVPGGRVRVRLEGDPLAILQMGNHFDTCLSLGAMNAFSTVANACELNKRVVYARDGAGTVVGRKLIGVTAEGDLVGFHTYASLPNEAGNAAVRAIVRRYLADFAARCGLKLANEGCVPTVFAEAWYDDGTVPWEDEGPASLKSFPRRSHRAARAEGRPDSTAER